MKLGNRIAVAALVVTALVSGFVLVRVVIPGLVNAQNDGALLAIPVILFAFGATIYAVASKLLSENEE